jgi:hypothetical protein
MSDSVGRVEFGPAVSQTRSLSELRRFTVQQPVEAAHEIRRLTERAERAEGQAAEAEQGIEYALACIGGWQEYAEALKAALDEIADVPGRSVTSIIARQALRTAGRLCPAGEPSAASVSVAAPVRLTEEQAKFIYNVVVAWANDETSEPPCFCHAWRSGNAHESYCTDSQVALELLRVPDARPSAAADKAPNG